MNGKMIIQSHRRAILSLRQHFLSSLISSPSISRPSSFQNRNANPNSLSSSFSTSAFRHDRHLRPPLKHLIPFIPPPLATNRSSRPSFHGVRTFARLSDSTNRPPKETIFLPGCDLEHWLVVLDAPDPQLTRVEIIDGYVKTLARVLGSEEEARKKIYSVSTKHYYAFGALVSEELSYKLNDQPHVRWVLPDSYLDVNNKTYAGEPFIDGQAVPYDPKYHAIYVRNHEQSLKSNVKNRRKQRDTDTSRLRSRSPPTASAPSSPSQGWMTASGTQNQDLEVSNMRDQASKHPSSSNPDVTDQNMMPSAARPDRMSQMSPMQNLAPPALSQSKAPQHSSMQNHSSAWAPPEASAAMDPNRQNWVNPNPNPNQNWTPAGSQHWDRHPSHMQNQMPPPPANSQTSKWNGPNQSWQPGARYQSPPPSPSQPSATMDLNRHTGGSQNRNQNHNAAAWHGQNQSWEPALGHQHQFGNFQPPSPATNMSSHMQSSDFNRGGIPAHVRENSCSTRQYQENYRDIRSSDPMVSPQGASNYQNANMMSAASSGDMPSYVQRPDFYGGDICSQVPKNDYYYRNMPGHVRNGTLQNGYAAQSPHQQGQTTDRGFRSSEALAFSQSRWSYQNAVVTPPVSVPSHLPNRDIPIEFTPSQVQQNGYAQREIRHDMQNVGSLNGYPSQTSQNQANQNAFKGLQSSNAMAPPQPQDWNRQNMTPAMPNNRFADTNTTHQSQNLQSRGGDMYDRESQYYTGPPPEQDNHHTGAMPGCSGTQTTQTRDLQERDMPADEEYVYASR